MRFQLLLLVLPLISCSSDPTPTAGGAVGGGGQGLLYFGLSVSLEIHKFNLATGEDKMLGKGDGPFSTPTGSLIFATPTDLAEANEDLASHRVIVKSDIGIEKSNNGFIGPQLSPDGTRIVYVTVENNMYVANRADGKILVRMEATGATDGWHRPTWTPDGRVVAAGGFGNPGLFISDADIKTMTRFDPKLAQPRDPAVSPDGTKVVFVLNDRLHLIGIDGGGLKRIDASEDKDSQPSWSPDGSKVIYRVGGRMKVMPAEGGAATDLFDAFPSLKDRHLVLSGSHPVHWK